MRLPFSSRTIHGMNNCCANSSGESEFDSGLESFSRGFRVLLGLGLGGAKVMLNSVEEEDREEVMMVRRWRGVVRVRESGLERWRVVVMTVDAADSAAAMAAICGGGGWFLEVLVCAVELEI